MKEEIKKFWEFLKGDSLASMFVVILLAFVIMVLIIFPLLELVTGTSLPLVIVESCSMFHSEEGFEKVFNSPIYSQNGINLEDTENWGFKKGLTKGDIIFVVGAKNIEKGDVIIFQGGSSHPIIHRVVGDSEPYATKGDNYKTNQYQLSSEKSIASEQVIGKAVFKIPYLGWIKLIFFDFGSKNSGFCRIE
jgi:hypothetical protein